MGLDSDLESAVFVVLPNDIALVRGLVDSLESVDLAPNVKGFAEAPNPKPDLVSPDVDAGVNLKSPPSFGVVESTVESGLASLVKEPKVNPLVTGLSPLVEDPKPGRPLELPKLNTGAEVVEDGLAPNPEKPLNAPEVAP